MRTFLVLTLAVALSTPALAKKKIESNNSQITADGVQNKKKTNDVKMSPEYTRNKKESGNPAKLGEGSVQTEPGTNSAKSGSSGSLR